MEQRWTRFKHWLIKKLGGYVQSPEEIKIGHYIGTPVPVYAEFSIPNEYLLVRPRDCYYKNKDGFRRYDKTDIEIMIEEAIAHKLATEIAQKKLYDVQICEDRMLNKTRYVAVANVLLPLQREGV